MDKSQFTETLATGRLLLLDGAMGTMLQAAGMPAGASPERFCLENEAILKSIHLAYLSAGSNIITTCTFGANPFKMAAGIDVADFNRRMALVARQAIRESGREGPLFVAGNVGPSGLFARPLGNLEPEELIAGFATQISGLVAGGADLIFIETQFDLAEARAAVVAARRVCQLPVMVSMTFEQGVSLTGSSPEIFAETMRNLDCAATGTNCSLGPDEMLPVVKALLAFSSAPVMAEPNAGLPELRDGKTVFPLTPERFAAKTAAFAELGVQILGGCCGTTPEHIRALGQACSGIHIHSRKSPASSGVVLTSRSRIVRIGAGHPLALIGERINPTGKKLLASQFQQGEFGEAMALASQQIEAGADVLDVNVGAPLVNERETLPRLTSLLVSRVLAPLSLDSPDAAAIAAAIPYCPGSCLVNSISGEAGRMAILAPLCRDFGAPAILLPIAGARMPLGAAQRIEILEKLILEAEAHGLPRRMLLIDALAMAVSSTPEAGRECLEVLRWCFSQNLATTLGLSNISFGLPARELLNATFLDMAFGAGLSSCIANPDATAIARSRGIIATLMGEDPDNGNFISNYASWQQTGAQAGPRHARREVSTLFEAVLEGDSESAIPLMEKELAQGVAPFAIVDQILIPAITEVGARYEKREYFLPQLVRSAETMQKAFKFLEPLLARDGDNGARPVIVLATVEGDIHDIGKNIVALLLGNHGFDVIDAGKDVPADRIVACAEEHGAAIIGLSALMTTTMIRMADTIRLIRKKNLPIKVMVGGAAVTQAFADSIGADGYSGDAVAAVETAKALLNVDIHNSSPDKE